jgi:hypothetical protein
VLSQPVAPHAGSVVLQAASQQLPVPVVPQTMEMQAELEVQAAPLAKSAVHVAELQPNPLTQSVFVAQMVRQPFPALLHWRLFGHAIGLPTLQVPAPLQLPWVIIAALHTAVPQAVLGEG